MLKRLEQNWFMRSRPVTVPAVYQRVNYQLQKHQQKVRNHMKTHDRLLVVHGTGSGKTLTSAYVAKDYIVQDPSRHIVVFVTPAAVSDQFRKSVSTVLPASRGVYFTTYTGLTLFLHKLYKSRHETFQKMMRHTMIIADEAHYISEKSEKARVFYTVFKNADKVMLMTGTPIINGVVTDLLPYAKILNPTLEINKSNIMNNYERFFKCKVSLYKVPDTSENFPRLLPTNRVNFPLSNNNLKKVNLNRERKYEYTKWMGTQTKNKKHRSGWAFNRSLYTHGVFGNRVEPKFTKFLEVYRQRPRKTIVFFKEYVTLRRFEEFLRSQGIEYRKVTGEETNKSSIISQNAPNSRMVYLLTSAAKEGLDFKGVRTLIFMDYPWVPSDYNQIVGRARRYKSHMMLPKDERNVKVYEFAYTHPVKKTLNVRSLNILSTKRARIAAILDRLRFVSIEKQRCVAPQRRRSNNNTNNRLRPRANRLISPNAGYAINPNTGNKYYIENLNVPFNEKMTFLKKMNSMKHSNNLGTRGLFVERGVKRKRN